MLTDACASPAQRAHNNYTENQISFLGALLISGLRFPVPAATLGAAWVAARVVYVLGVSVSKTYYSGWPHSIHGVLPLQGY